MKSKLAVLPFILLTGIALVRCSDPEEELPRLEFPSTMPKELTVGDTTAPLVVTRVTVDARGRQSETATYGDFAFKSSDTATVRVIDGRRLLGVAAGTASVTAFDNQGTAKTKGGRDVTVKARP